MALNLNITSVTDWFIPANLLEDREMRSRARMFLFSHMFGPILGNAIPGLLFWMDSGSGAALGVLAGSICCFWIFPFALKYTGRYQVLSYLSIQNLLFAILWGCYYYGGLSSPFLPWLVTVPLLAFFYLGASVRSCVTILLQISASIAVFVAQLDLVGGLPHTVPLSQLQGVGLVSIVSAAIYVSMMAMFYAGILASQSEFEKEVRKHIETANQLREATTQAERANAAKADFLAKMSHELRTPLNAVIGYSQILIEDTDPVTDAQGFGDLQKIHDAGHHLLAMVNAILDLSKIEAGRMETYNRLVDVRAFLNEMSERWGRDPRLAARALTIEASDEIGIIDTDAEKMEQVLAILLDNAVRYAPHSDVKIQARRVATETMAEKVEIAISDQGPGIPPQLLPAMFDIFNDLDGANAKKFGGPGLGLPLANKLCALLEVEMHARSTFGVGTTFTLAFPAGRALAAPVAARASAFAAAA